MTRSREVPEPSPARDAVPLSARICGAACASFAIWTLCSHAVVAAGGGLRSLVGLYAVVGLASLGAVAWARRRGVRLPAGLGGVRDASGKCDGRGEPVEQATVHSPVPRWVRPALSLFAAAAAILAFQSGDPVLLWWMLLAVWLAAAVVFLVLEPPRCEPAQDRPALEIGLWSIAVLCAVCALIAHRPDLDDVFYINLAVAAVDRPELALLASDTLHGRDDLPIHFPIYRLQSYELLNAAISLLTGIPAVRVFHWIAAAVAALFVPLCHAVLFRLLTPRIWLWTTGALIAVLIATGEMHRGYGNFAFVRIWQGKGIFLFVFLPLVYAYAIRFATRPSLRSWLLLAAAQIASVGCTSSALWVAPLAAWAAMACALRPSWSSARHWLLGALSSGYVLAAGLLLKGPMSIHVAKEARVFDAGEQLAVALAIVLGSGLLHAVAIAVLFVAWACCRRGLARRFAIAIPLSVALLLLDPYTDTWVRTHLTGPLYWRVMWALPVPILFALVLAAPLQWNRLAWRRRAGAATCALLTLAFAVTVPSHSTISAINRVGIGLPTLKVDPVPYRWAGILNRIAPRKRVVAPPSISTWIPVFHDHAYPMTVRSYLQPNRDAVGKVAYRDRFVMTHFVDGELRHLEAETIFARGLELYDVTAVCLKNSSHAETVRRILRTKGYRRQIQGLTHEIWVRI